MENRSIPILPISDPLLPILTIDDRSKNERAINVFQTGIKSYLQTIMADVGFDIGSRDLNQPTFTRYMLLTLVDSTKQLYNFKINSRRKISKGEKCTLERMIEKCSSMEIAPKMQNAVDNFNSYLPTYLQNVMLDAGFHSYETDLNHNSFICFVSNVVVSFTQIFVGHNACVASEHCQKVEGRVTESKSSLQLEEASADNYNDSINKVIQMISNEKELHSTNSSIELMTTTRNHTIYCVFTSKKFTLKVLRFNPPQAKDIEHLDNEIQISKSISHPAFRHSFARTTYLNKQALVLEWASGFPINEISEMKRFCVKDFLVASREIVSSLLAMHMKNIMHLNLTCDHIIFNPETSTVKIIGYGSSTSFGTKKNYISNKKLSESDLRFISPEQTGRFNREVDFRSDFYSLGVVFYKLLTGKHPFENDNAMRLVCMHLFQDALPMRTFDSSIPTPVSHMVLKLMKKNAEDRYQSAKGIIHDLDLMISEYDSDNKLSSIHLGLHDSLETFLVPQKLYGRSKEYNALSSVFGRSTLNCFQLAFVMGDSGTGKSTLVFELQKVVLQKDGFFVSGKFDKFNMKPFSALLEAVNNFCDDLLLKEESIVSKYKYKIQNAIGDEGKILTDVLTKLHLIIGQQPIISDIFGQEAKNRFNYVFIKFFKAICSVGFPIVLIIDDLQWIDSETHNLFSSLLTESSIKNFIFIGTYRENEVSDVHPVSNLLRRIKRNNISTTMIKLDNLDHENSNDLISDALFIAPLESYPLTAWVHSKTKGNPYFINQMLKSLCEQDSIFFCNERCKWKWDATKFDENNMTENVLELIRQKILTLDVDSQQALKVASCLDSPFSLDILKKVVNCKGIESAISAAMIAGYKGSKTLYRFAHDNVQQAAHSFLPEDTNFFFWQIGMKLWTTLSSKELNENVFTIANLLMNAIDIANDQEDPSKMSDLFLRAGKKAMTSTAFKQAFTYLHTGIQLLNSDSWNTHYKLTLHLYNTTAKAAYCIKDYTKMNEFISEILKNVSTMHQVDSYLLQIKYYNDYRMHEDAIRVGINILDQIGEKIDLSQSDLVTDSEVQKAKQFITKESIMTLTDMDNEISLAVMAILNNLMTSSFFSNSKLFRLIASRMVLLTFKHGVSKHSSTGFCALGSVLCSKGDALGYQFGKLALVLLKRAQVKEMIPSVYNIFYLLISPFHESVHNSYKHLLEAVQISLEIGLHVEFLYSFSNCSSLSMFCGKNLAKSLDCIQELQHLLPVKTLHMSSVHQATLNLISGDTEKAAVLCGSEFNYKRCFDGSGKNGDLSRALVVCSVVSYLFYDYPSAFKFAATCRPLKDWLRSSYMYPVYIFYDCLISLAYATRGKEDKDDLIKKAEENILCLKGYSSNAPQNYLNKVHLLEAEMAVALGNASQAVALYKKSILLSEKNNFPNEAALGYERVGILFQTSNATIATKLLLQSYKCYKKWGATAKLKHMVNNFPHLLNDETLDLLKDDEILNVQLESNSSTVSELSEIPSIRSRTSHTNKRVRFS